MERFCEMELLDKNLNNKGRSKPESTLESGVQLFGQFSRSFRAAFFLQPTLSWRDDARGTAVQPTVFRTLRHARRFRWFSELDVTLLDRVKKNFFTLQKCDIESGKAVRWSHFVTVLSQFVTNVTTPRDFRYLVDPDSRLDSGYDP